MTDHLVGPVGDRDGFSGAGLLESGTGMCRAISDGDWVDIALNGVAMGFDVYATAMDPLGSLFAAGIGWVIDHLEPIKGWFDDLAGNPEAVQAHAATWLNVSNSLAATGTAFFQGAHQKLDRMSGPNADRYQLHVDEMVDKLRFVSGASRAMSVGTETAAMLVAFVHGLLRDALAQIVGAICSYVAELVFTLGLATPLVISQATSRVSALSAEIGPKIRGLKNSVTDLDSLMSELRDILNDVPRFLGDRYSTPNLPGVQWRTVLDDPLTGLHSFSVRQRLALVQAKPKYAHLVENNPALWHKAVNDAFADATPNTVNDLLKALNDALERQLEAQGG